MAVTVTTLETRRRNTGTVNNPIGTADHPELKHPRSATGNTR